MSDALYIGVAAAEMVPTIAFTTVFGIKRRPGDKLRIQSGTTGEMARTSLVDEFLANDRFGAYLFLDGDQVFPTNTAERLRESGKDFIGGHYVRRAVPIFPIAHAADKAWPMHPMVDHPTTGLVEIGATGFGCLYAKRQVFLDIMGTLQPGEPLIANYPLPEATGNWSRVGADLRFCWKARQLAGYKLFMDMDLHIGHVAQHALSMKDYKSQGGGRLWADTYRDTAARKLRGG